MKRVIEQTNEGAVFAKNEELSKDRPVQLFVLYHSTLTLTQKLIIKLRENFFTFSFVYFLLIHIFFFLSAFLLLLLLIEINKKIAQYVNLQQL